MSRRQIEDIALAATGVVAFFILGLDIFYWRA
jgi:hypothetical protein